MKALIIHRDMMPALDTLTDADLGALTRAAMSLVTDSRDEPPENPALAFAWITLRTKILEHGRRYDDECQRRSDHARSAAEARYAAARPFKATPPRHAPASPSRARA